MINHTIPELLAPAGDWEAMRAAVSNGADAVYFGLDAFNARARAANFSLKELPEVMRYLHDHNVRGFVALNVLIFSDELPRAADVVRACAEAGVDAVIVQDLGLVKLIRELAPALPIHGSTQMTLTEPRGIEFIRSLGVERVVLARELSLPDIRKITASTTTPVEVFIHGALCVAYSGQCLTSEALGGRSANRGQCAQACRLPYEMIVDGTKRDLGDKAYLLSPQDLAAYELVKQLIEAGVVSFKIEGRLKGGPYVAATTQTYRQAIDEALADKPLSLTTQQKLDLAQTFSRGLGHGFLDGVNHQVLVRGRFPKSRGNKLGRVLRFSNKAVVVELEPGMSESLKAGDGVLFDLGTPGDNEPGGRLWRVQTFGSQFQAELEFEPNALDFSRIPKGTTIWKTDDPELNKRLKQSYNQDKVVRRRPLHATLKGTLGGDMTLTLTSDSGLSASATWSGPLVEANKPRDTTADELRKTLGRLGDTPFELGDIEASLPPNALVPKSVLNDLRRQCAAELMKHRHTGHAVANPKALAELRSELPTKNSELPTPQLSVLVRNLAQLEAVLKLKPAMVYADFEDLRKYGDAVPMARDSGVTLVLATNRIWKPGEDGFQSLVVRAKPDAVLVRNLGSLAYFREQLPQATLYGDFSLNVANDLTAKVFRDSGLSRMVPSFDLNWQQLSAMLKHSDPAWYECVIHQHMPMFHMEHCVFAAFLSTGKDHTDCGRPCETHTIELRDRTGVAFPVHPDTGCRNTVFNSVAQSGAEYISRMKEHGVRWFRLDLLREKSDEIPGLVEQYRRVIDGTDDGKQTWKQLKALNQLGVTRGTLSLV
jgi:U32 family peptidase